MTRAGQAVLQDTGLYPRGNGGKAGTRPGGGYVRAARWVARALVLLDDPYRYLTYENEPRYFNLSSARALSDHIVYLFTFSKTFAMSGWRLGYMILPALLKKEALKVHDATIICAPRISQLAGVIALRGRADHLTKFERILAARRDLIMQRLDRVPHVFDYIRPEGAY